MLDSDVAPILEFDRDREAVIEPHAVRKRIDVPERAVLCFFSDVIDELAARGARSLTELQAAHGRHPVYEVEHEGERIAVFHPGVGAPLAGAFLEEAIACGCARFIGVGGAGGLIPDLTIGHVVVPTAAVRDEGTSYHYAPPERESAPDPAALRTVEAVLDEASVPWIAGKAWTTDAPYRETRTRIARRIAEGCLVVDMESAALFTIAGFRGVPLAMILAAADDLSGERWDDRGFIADLSIRERLFWLAADAVLRL
jgi:uridine phosphorylase